jgi:hypothetical protein
VRVVQFAALAALSVSPAIAQSLVPPPPPPGIDIPDWALPNTGTHIPVAPPADFHRASVTTNATIGQFDARTDVGGALVPGSASYDPASATYTINSAGYNIWYRRDEFHYLWKKMTGDVSLVASVVWPNSDDFHDRKVVLVIRDTLDDDSREIMAAQQGNGLIQIAHRPEKNALLIADAEYRGNRQPQAVSGDKAAKPQAATNDYPMHAYFAGLFATAIPAARIGIEKKADAFQLYVSWQGEPLHPEGRPVIFKTKGPFYAGIGFTSHLAANVLTTKIADVVVKNAAGQVR